MTVRNHLLVLILAAIAALGAPGHAGNIDVSTIPQRESVQLTIYNSEDITLVRETRRLTFKQGLNPLQFSWANTLIDPSSVDLQFIDHKDELDLLDTTYPHDRPQVLEWSIRSRIDGEAMVQITYFTSGISWAADYACVSDAAESTMSFEGYVRVMNNSGEDYKNASVRLVVGTINLVEKVAMLAQRGIISADSAREFEAHKSAAPAAPLPAPARAVAGRALEEALADRMDAKEITKEGLSEYFIYTIEGTETIPNGWAKRLRLFEGVSVPFKVEYRYRPQEYGDQLVRILLVRNTTESKLGTTPLPDGMVRLFRDNGRDGLSFVAQHYSKYVPIGQNIELNLGVDPEVIHERVRTASWRDNFWFLGREARKYFSPTGGDRIEPTYEVAGWDEHARGVERIRNYRATPVSVELRLTIPGDVTFTGAGLGAVAHDFQTVQIAATVQPGETKDLAYEVTMRQGINSKQNRVEVK